MTITNPSVDQVELRPVALDLYRDIHKGIRAELFALTSDAGNLDPSSEADRIAHAAHLDSVVDLLVSHAGHEDAHVQPAVEIHLPALAEQIAADHERLEARMDDLRGIAADAVSASGERARFAVQRSYVEVASFTSAYLAHQDLEERIVMPALEDAIGVDAVVAIHTAIVSSIPPDEMARSLAVMLPAMNLDDRAELLGGMREGAPVEVFAGVWSLAGSVLDAPDAASLAARLDIE